MLGLAFLVIIQIMFLKGKSSDIADVIRIRYEETFVKKIPKLAEKNYKLWNCELNLRFSLECKKKVFTKANFKKLFVSYNPHRKKYFMGSVANSGRSSVIADRLGLLVGQNRCRFLKMTKHN